jgi:LysM repeat protein
VIRAEMKVLQAELAAMNARIERLLAMIPPAAEPADAPTDDEVATGDEVATDDDVAPAEAPAAAEPTDDEAAAPAFDQAYQIQWGDTLTGLAQAFGTTVEAIAEANEIADPDMIYAGDTLMVPAAPAEGTFDAATLAAPAPTAPVPPAAPALPPIPVPGA